MGQLGSFTLTGGEVHDVTEACGLLVEIEAKAVIADKAFDSDELISFIREGEAKAVIPARSNRISKHRLDRKRYRDRNRIERFFCRLKHVR